MAIAPSGEAVARRVARALGAALHGREGRVGGDVAFPETTAHVRDLFAAGVPIVGVCAAGVLIRAVAPLLSDKRAEPPVVAVAEDGSCAVPLLSGHRGANALARRVARALGGVAAVTTAGDLALGVALDAPPQGWRLANPEDAGAAMAAALAGGLRVEGGVAFEGGALQEMAARLPDTTARARERLGEPGGGGPPLADEPRHDRDPLSSDVAPTDGGPLHRGGVPGGGVRLGGGDGPRQGEALAGGPPAEGAEGFERAGPGEGAPSTDGGAPPVGGGFGREGAGSRAGIAAPRSGAAGEEGDGPSAGGPPRGAGSLPLRVPPSVTVASGEGEAHGAIAPRALLGGAAPDDGAAGGALRGGSPRAEGDVSAAPAASEEDRSSGAGATPLDGGARGGRGHPFDVAARPDGAVALLATEASAKGGPGRLVYHPQRHVLGLGCARGADPAALWALVGRTLDEAGVAPGAVAAVATIALKADEPAVLEAARRLGAPLRLFDAEALEAETPRLATPSRRVFAEVGAHGVAEAAALACAGPEAALVVPKRKTGEATCALARAPRPLTAPGGRPRGRLSVVGIGPGRSDWRTPEASRAVASADEIVGYGLYIDLLGPLAAGKPRADFPLGGEEARCRHALERAGAGLDVALVCSGDAGVYAMASLVFETIDRGGVSDAARRAEVVVSPGVSAMQAAAARAGAPLGHDFCAISLSDLLTPREDILRRVRAAAAGDFAVAFYNPVSKRRRTLLAEARDILLGHRPEGTPVVLAASVGRGEEAVRHVRLADLRVDDVDMLTLVIVGSSRTRRVGPWCYTPRGYAAGRPGSPGPSPHAEPGLHPAATRARRGGQAPSASAGRGPGPEPVPAEAATWTERSDAGPRAAGGPSAPAGTARPRDEAGGDVA